MNANNIIDELNAQLDAQDSAVEEKKTILISEVNTWKQKFIELNRYRSPYSLVGSSTPSRSSS